MGTTGPSPSLASPTSRPSSPACRHRGAGGSSSSGTWWTTCGRRPTRQATSSGWSSTSRRERMAVSTFETTVRRRGDASIIDLHGEVDLAADGALGAAYTEATGTDPAAVVLNFSGVDYINS